MTDLLHLDDSYLRAFQATATEAADDGAVTLDQTAFYATGGGQPHDTGTLTDGPRLWSVTAGARGGGIALVDAVAGSGSPT